MDLSETHLSPLPDAIPKLLKQKTVEVELPQRPYFSAAAFASALEKGGLPGILAVRDSEIRRQRFETQIETFLERDLRLLVQTSLSFRSLRSLPTALAIRQGSPLELSGLSRATRISAPTLRKLINALEAMFVIRLIETEGSRIRPVIFFEDQGEATHLAQGVRDSLSDLTRFLFSNLRPQWIYRPELGVQPTQLRNRGGAFVPLVLRNKLGSLGIIPILDENPGRHELASARSFLDRAPGSKAIFVHLGTNDRVHSRSLRTLPVSSLV